MAILQDVGG